MERSKEPPRSPSGRVPKWVLDEQAGHAPDTTWRSAGTPPPGCAGPRRRRRRRRLFAALVATAFVIGAGLAWQFRDRIDQFKPAAGTGSAVNPLPANSTSEASADAERSDDTRSPQLQMPTAGHEEADRPLQTPPAVTAPSSAYAVFDKNPDGTPVAYDPCRPIHYVTRPDGAPFGGDTLVQAGIARLSEVTGLQFVNDGTTDEQPRPKRQPFQPDRYGDRWAPVLIAWQSAQDNPDLVSDVAGEAGSVLVGTDGKPAVYVSGQVVLDGAQFSDILTRPDGQAEARGIILHELGHLVGLDHVDDPTQIMYPRSQPGVSDYAAGDLTGLATLGQGPCASWL